MEMATQQNRKLEMLFTQRSKVAKDPMKLRLNIMRQMEANIKSAQEKQRKLDDRRRSTSDNAMDAGVRQGTGEWGKTAMRGEACTRTRSPVGGFSYASRQKTRTFFGE